jgi:hypothetical protein
MTQIEATLSASSIGTADATSVALELQQNIFSKPKTATTRIRGALFIYFNLTIDFKVDNSSSFLFLKGCTLSDLATDTEPDSDSRADSSAARVRRPDAFAAGPLSRSLSLFEAASLPPPPRLQPIIEVGAQ